MTAPVNFYADFKGLAALKAEAGKDGQKQLREVARQFESLFTRMMLKSMRDASLGDSMMESDETKNYQDMFDNQMSVQLSRGKGLGLADLLVKQLTESGLKSADAATAKTSNGVTQEKPAALRAPGRSMSITPVENVIDKIIAPITKGGAEGGTREVQGVTPSVPNSSSGTQSDDSAAEPVIDSSSKKKNASEENAHLSDEVTSSTSKRSGTHRALTQTPGEFIAAMWPHAQAAAAELGVDAKTLIAHAALETGWGKHVPCNPDGSCSFNLFGVKAGQGWTRDTTSATTVEYVDGVATSRNENFRSYSSPADSFRDYAVMLKNSPRYANAVGSGADAAKFAGALQRGGYATDPAYANKLTATAQGVNSRVNAALKSSTIQPLASSSSVSSDMATTRQASET